MPVKSIWIFNQYAGDSKSGWGERSFYLSEEFVKMGYDVTIFSGTNNHLFSNIHNFKGAFKIKYDSGVRFVWIKTLDYKKSNSFKRIISWFQFVIKIFLFDKTKIKKPDYIIVSSMPIFPIVNAIFYKFYFNTKKIVFEIRDIWPLTLISLGKISKYNPFVLFLGFFEKLAYKKSDLIVSVLRGANCHIKKITKKDFNFLWIPNGIKTFADYSSEDVTLKNYLKLIPKKKFLIFYTGSLNRANAMKYVIKAMDFLLPFDSIHLVIIGNGERLLKLKRLSNNKNITFLPKLPKNQLQSILTYASCFIISWRKESLYKFGVSPNKYADYMLAAKPIIVANSFPENDIVKISNSGLIAEAENIESIADKILKLYKSKPIYLKQLGENGKRYALKNLIYRNLALKYLEGLHKT